jgi:thiol-disulfide isomerase/thioredoxin
VPSGIRTVTTIGDRTVPVVSGETGQEVAAAAEEPAPEPAPARRISGRVLDEKGRPVPDATVRLAINGAPVGRSISVTTDDAGRFALTNLRTGSTYSLIAEWEDPRGELREARLAAEAPSRNVEIRLAEPADAPSPRIERVSGDEESYDEPEPLPQPAELAGDAADPPVGEVAHPPPDEGEPRSLPSGSWRRTAEAGNPRRERGGFPAPPGDTEQLDEGPNPLPPALEREPDTAPARIPEPDALRPEPVFRSEASSGPRPPEFPPDPAPSAPVPAEAAQPAAAGQGVAPSEALIDRALAPEASGSTAPVTQEPPAYPPLGGPASGPPQIPDDRPEPSIPEPSPTGGTGESPAPAPLPEPVSPPPNEPEPARSGAPEEDMPGDTDDAVRGEAGTAPVAPEVEPVPDPSETPAPTEPAPEAQAAAPARDRPTWGEVAAVQLAAHRPSADRGALELNGPGSRGAGLPMTRDRDRSASSARASCQYDARLRRLIDFTLPDIEGRPVRFQELDADLVLLDFWGTWCAPCVRSVPHLVELQREYGDRLKVVGIAYEQGEARESAAAVAATARRLGINYTLLLAGADGRPCPVQNQLLVNVYPTMVLLDRHGRTLWRAEGATTETLARLDREIAKEVRADIARR